MNKNITKIVFLAILGVVLGYFLYTRVLSESEEDRQWREQYEADQKARESGQPAAAAPGGASPAPAEGGTIREDEIDLELLAAGIKKVEFNYAQTRRAEQRRNPMTPLVGPYVETASELASAMGGEASSASDEAVLAAIRRNLLLSGIMWHPTAPVAIINNEVVPAGHQFPSEMFRTARAANGLEDAVTVERMTQDSVILKYRNSEITLELKER